MVIVVTTSSLESSVEVSRRLPWSFIGCVSVRLVGEVLSILGPRPLCPSGVLRLRFQAHLCWHGNSMRMPVIQGLCHSHLIQSLD